MLSKEKANDFATCFNHNCGGCSWGKSEDCVTDYEQSVLRLLERIETAETILNDILSSGNVKSCEREIREFLEGDE